LQGEVGACVEQRLAYFWLFVATHETIFSRNERYVYCSFVMAVQPRRSI